MYLFTFLFKRLKRKRGWLLTGDINDRLTKQYIKKKKILNPALTHTQSKYPVSQVWEMGIPVFWPNLKNVCLKNFLDCNENSFIAFWQLSTIKASLNPCIFSILKRIFYKKSLFIYLLRSKGYPSLQILKLINEKMINLVDFRKVLNPRSGKTTEIYFHLSL